METSSIKKFAIEARNILKTGVLNKIASLGFDADGKVEEKNRPMKVQPGAIFMGAHITDDTFYDKWMSLHQRIQQKGIKEVCEEAAYTWFNRLMAVRIMQKNDFISPMLTYEDELVRIPHIVAEARRGLFPTMTEDNRRALLEHMKDDSKVTEQFTSLILAFCQFNSVLKACFGTVNDYTELLLPKNILAEGGFIDLLNHTDFISDDDYRSPELIGWLYQFYISEKKDEVFASFKNAKKAEAEDIPAATQIFTPNWIVKYMVQNTVGRIYLDNNPYSRLSEQMNYLVEPSEPTPEEAKLTIADIETLKMIDPACGSGHILIEAFELFYQIYQEEGYSRRQAIESILTKNISGIDLDTRAKQLAMFALLMAACKRDTSFFEANVLPRVLDMSGIPALYTEMKGDLSDLLLTRDERVLTEIMEAMELLQQADNLGSIMKFSISEVTRETIVRRLTEYEAMAEIPVAAKAFLPAFRLILTLTDKYAAVVANPPYMKATNMNDRLKRYVERNYPISCLDLYSIFMKKNMELIMDRGKLAMIVQPTWLINSTFADLRKDILDNFSIESLLHMGRGNFGNDWGSITFTLCKSTNVCISKFFKLYERTFYRINSMHIASLFLLAKKDVNFRYNFSEYSTEISEIKNDPNGKRICYLCKQDEFRKILNSPYCYSFSGEIIKIINQTNISSAFYPATGLQTGNNNKFIKTWFELNNKEKGDKWIPLVNGGNFRKWYGNFMDLILWENNGAAIKNSKSSVLRNQQYYMRSGITWNRIASRGITLRFFPSGFIFDQAGDSMFSENQENLLICMAYLNTKVAKTFFDMLAPTINLTAGMIGKLPYLTVSNSEQIKRLVSQNIRISQNDWDSHETSWDFQFNELISFQSRSVESRDDNGDISIFKTVQMPMLLEEMYYDYCDRWYETFMMLHHNEEDLNRQFIEIYGLQDELTPDVPLSEITILQQGEITIKDNEITFNKDVVMKQFISYVVGCWMGRYRLDRPGLQIAHPHPTEEETTPYQYNNETFVIDDDAIIPLMPRDCAFDDNAFNRFIDFVRITFGTVNLTQNLNFIEAGLGKTIEDYFVKDFWKGHKKMYQNRPIYWLFTSKKGAFQCVAYMHRMDAYTAEKIRNKYLLPHIEYLSNRITEMDSRVATLSMPERKKLDNFRKDLNECQEYHDRLHAVADAQISFDLDDGVTVNYAKFGDVVAKLK